MKKTKATLFTMGIVTSTAIIFSCGGGGGGSAEGSIKIEPAKTEDVEKVVSSVTAVSNSLENVENSTGVLNYLTGINVNPTSTSTNYKLVPFVLRKIQKYMSNNIRTQESADYEDSCENGGNITGKISWTNPDCKTGDEEACYKNNHIKGYFEAQNCNEGYVIYNGKISVEVNFDGEGEITYASFMTDNLKADLDNDMLDVPYDYIYPNFSITYEAGHKYYSLSMNGDLIGEAVYTNVKDLKASFSKFKIEQNIIKEDSYGDPTEENYILNGGLSIYENNSKVLDISTKDLSIYEKYGAGLNDPDTSRINGYIYEGVCTKKWFQIKTLKDIKYPPNQTCPTDGKIQINGNVTVEATEQGGLIVSDGNETKTYNSCKDISKEDACTM